MGLETMGLETMAGLRLRSRLGNLVGRAQRIEPDLRHPLVASLGGMKTVATDERQVHPRKEVDEGGPLIRGHLAYLLVHLIEKRGGPTL
jgi:hypothetical protein